MDRYDASTYGDRIADTYDARYPARYGAAGDVDGGVLKSLAGDGPALELGIGTGRVALPLASSGVRVHGIDASEAMVAEMRKKPGGPDIPVTIGDFAAFQLEERFPLIYVVFNTFFGLATQEDQISCFASVANHLDDGGVFLLQAFVPNPALLAAGSSVKPGRIELDFLDLDVASYDLVNQVITVQYVEISDTGTRLFPVVLRYAYPAELDLMARLAGLRLRERWGGWDKEPFGAGSGKHVSIYERAV